MKKKDNRQKRILKIWRTHRANNTENIDKQTKDNAEIQGPWLWIMQNIYRALITDILKIQRPQITGNMENGQKCYYM